MSNLVTRTLSGIVYATVMVCAVIFTPYASEILFIAISILAVHEYHQLMQSDKWITFWSIILAVCLNMLHASRLNGLPTHEHFWQLVFALLLIFVLASELFRKAENPMRNWGNLLISLVMLALPLSLGNDILAMGEWSAQRWILLAVFVCIWLNDSGAYCVGSLVGKHKMFPRVSPGKSWEGLVGGVIASLLTGWVFSICLPQIPLLHWLLLALTVSFFGTFGDLMESLFKRTLGVKDSGNFLPGHGGVLDRFDSILLSLPAVWLLLQALA